MTTPPLPTALLSAAIALGAACSSDDTLITPIQPEDSSEAIGVISEALTRSCRPRCTGGGLGCDNHGVGVCTDGHGHEVPCPTPALETGVQSGGDRCVAWMDRGFGGDGVMSLGVDRVYHYVGDDMNDTISSFRVAEGAYLIAWDNENEGGESVTIYTDAEYIGDRMNDRISSFACLRCP